MLALLAPDGQFVAVRVGEVEAASAGKAEDFADDLAACRFDLCVAILKSYCVKDHKSSTGLASAGVCHRGIPRKAACQSAVKKAGVIRTVILKVPAEDLGVEALGGFDVGCR